MSPGPQNVLWGFVGSPLLPRGSWEHICEGRGGGQSSSFRNRLLFANCQLWHSLSLPTIWQPRATREPTRVPPKKQLSSPHCVEGTNKMCIFPLFQMPRRVCVCVCGDGGNLPYSRNKLSASSWGITFQIGLSSWRKDSTEQQKTFRTPLLITQGLH